ncbi:MAG: hypothetical protein C0401_06875 [Anaerolinea sp.]|nr:hypothetical protein [Anaerolinea sp.]
MNNNSKNQKQEAVTGGILLVFGILLFVAGLVLKSILPVFEPYLKLVESIGFFLVAVGIWNLVKHFNYQKNPTALRKARVENMDERKLWIRYHAGNNAFKFGITAAYLALLVTGVTQGSISSDWVWWGLAFIVVGTMVVYIVSVIRYENMY